MCFFPLQHEKTKKSYTRREKTAERLRFFNNNKQREDGYTE